MTRTFLVSVNEPDDGSANLEDTIGDIEDALNAAGIDYEEVKVWQSPGATVAPTQFQNPFNEPPPPPNPFA